MKHDDKKKRFREQRSAGSDSATVKAGSSLQEFWAELQRAKAAGEPLPVGASAPRAADGGAWLNGSPDRFAGSFPFAGSFRSSGSGSGSGSGGGGYGLALIAPDPASLERIRRIMRSLCDKDAKRGQ